MCASNDPATLRRLRRRKEPIGAWKILQKSGTNVWTGYTEAKYGPGRVKAVGVTRTTHYGFSHRGLHTYRMKPCAQIQKGPREVIVPAYIDPKDLIAAEPPGAAYGSQLVTCRLTIRPEDWAAAGLPKRATRDRYV